MFLALPGKLVEVGGAIINTIKDGFLNSFGALKDTVVQGFQELRNLLPFSDAKKGPFSDLTQSGRALVETISKGIRDRQHTMSAAMEATAEGAMATMDETLGKSPLAVDATVSSAAPAAPSLPSLVQPVTRAAVPITQPQSQSSALADPGRPPRHRWGSYPRGQAIHPASGPDHRRPDSGLGAISCHPSSGWRRCSDAGPRRHRERYSEQCNARGHRAGGSDGSGRCFRRCGGRDARPVE